MGKDTLIENEKGILVVPERMMRPLKRPLKKEESKPKSLSFYTSTCRQLSGAFFVY
jgi:hypothetical protein